MKKLNKGDEIVVTIHKGSGTEIVLDAHAQSSGFVPLRFTLKYDLSTGYSLSRFVKIESHSTKKNNSKGEWKVLHNKENVFSPKGIIYLDSSKAVITF